MADIVERLRNAPTAGANKSNDYTMQARHFHEAADEIERLRQSLKDYCDLDNDALLRENDRLREALHRADRLITAIKINAFKVGLEGTSEWDRVAGAADIHGVQDTIQAALKVERKYVWGISSRSVDGGDNGVI